MNIAVRVTSVQAERFVEPEDPLPGNLQISMNINVGKIEGSGEKAKGMFLLDIGYQPSIARITVEGRILVSGKKDEIERLIKDLKSGKIPQPVIQSVYTAGFSEAVLLCRSVGVPPPLPSLPAPTEQKKGSEGMEYSI